MALEQRLLEKLKPHAERINSGDHTDFDYLPGVLAHLIERQASQEHSFSEAVERFSLQGETLARSAEKNCGVFADGIANLGAAVSQSEKAVSKSLAATGATSEQSLAAVNVRLTEAIAALTGKIDIAAQHVEQQISSLGLTVSQGEKTVFESVSAARTASERCVAVVNARFTETVTALTSRIDEAVQQSEKQFRLMNRMLYVTLALSLIAVVLGAVILLRR